MDFINLRSVFNRKISAKNPLLFIYTNVGNHLKIDTQPKLNMKPNIFEISTKELSQDAFITWLMMWADNSNKQYDENLNKCSINFIESLIKKEHVDFDEKISKVSVYRQINNIDVYAEINDKYLIIIEDKTNSKQHSNQLLRYKSYAESVCNDKNYEKPICIYLKTGNESFQNLNSVRDKGFKIYDRKQFVNILNKYEIKNNIYQDFKLRLKRLEHINNQWEAKPIKEWNGDDWQGFFQFLDEEIELVGWDYVNNPSGGFWNAVLNWNYWGIYPAYVQIEQHKLCFKVSTDPAEVTMPEGEKRGSVRNNLSRLIIDTAKEKGLNVKKPKRFGSGKYMTVAVVEPSDWFGNINEKIDSEAVKKNLIGYKEFLQELIK